MRQRVPRWLWAGVLSVGTHAALLLFALSWLPPVDKHPPRGKRVELTIIRSRPAERVIPAPLPPPKPTRVTLPPPRRPAPARPVPVDVEPTPTPVTPEPAPRPPSTAEPPPAPVTTEEPAPGPPAITAVEEDPAASLRVGGGGKDGGRGVAIELGLGDALKALGMGDALRLNGSDDGKGTPAALKAAGFTHKDFMVRARQSVQREWKLDKALKSPANMRELGLQGELARPGFSKGEEMVDRVLKGEDPLPAPMKPVLPGDGDTTKELLEGHERRSRIVVMATLDPQGRVLRAVVVEKGQAPFLDEEAIRAVKSAAPYVNPPSSLFKDGNIQLKVTFLMTTLAPSIVRLLMSSAAHRYCIRKEPPACPDCVGDGIEVRASLGPCVDTGMGTPIGGGR